MENDPKPPSSGLRSRGHSENCVDEGDLSHDITFASPFDLSLANHVHRLVPFERPSSCIEQAKSQSRLHAQGYFILKRDFSKLSPWPAFR